MKKDIRILLVDDHQVVRDGLRHMLGREKDMEVVGEAADAKEAMDKVEMLSPEVILMDIKMPGIDGIELTRQLKGKHPKCNIIMLTLYDEYLAQAMQVGAGGYLLKDIKYQELAQAIRQVHQGKVVISDNITPEAKAEVYKQRQNGSLPEDVQLVIHPPIEANQLIRFVSRVEEMLQSRTLRMVSSWKGGTAITIPLLKPTPLENIINEIGEMPEVEKIGEKPLAGDADPTLFRKAAAISRPKTMINKTIFVTLKNGHSEGQDKQRDKEPAINRNL